MPDLTPHRATAEKIFRQALELHNPTRVVSQFIQSNSTLLPPDSKIDLVATGKCGLYMAHGAISALGDRITRGLVISNATGGGLPERIRFLRSAHPVPDERSIAAAEGLIDFISSGQEDSTLLYLMSGGSSAMVAFPANGITLEEKRDLTSILMKNGIEISDLNLVRSYFSGIKGGKLLKRVKAQKTVVLVLSDVLSNDLSVIGSGVLYPRVIDPSEVMVLLEKYGSPSSNPVVRKCIAAAQRGEKEVPPSDNNAEHFIIDSNESFIKDLTLFGEKEGYKIIVASEPVTGSIDEAVDGFFDWVSKYPPTHGKPLMMVAGSETGVKVKGNGIGGRNSEFAMRAAPILTGSDNVLLAAGTDGIDGATQSAGAIVDGESYRKGEAKGLNYEEMLANNDSGSWCDATGSSLITGQTGVNLADVLLLIKA